MKYMQGILRKVFRYKLISVFFIVSQLVMFYSVFGALSIYNKAYAKEQDRIDSLYKNDIEMNITTGNANDMFKFLPRYRRCECIAMASFVALVAGRKYAF